MKVIKDSKKKRTRCWNWSEDAVFIYHPKIKTSWQGISYMLTNANKHIHTHIHCLIAAIGFRSVVVSITQKDAFSKRKHATSSSGCLCYKPFLKPGLLWFLCQLLTNYNTMCLFVCLNFFFSFGLVTGKKRHPPRPSAISLYSTRNG